MRNNGKTVVVPVHKPIIPIETLKSIEKQSGLDFMFFSFISNYFYSSAVAMRKYTIIDVASDITVARGPPPNAGSPPDFLML